MLNLDKDEVGMAALQLYHAYGYTTEEIEQKLGWTLLATKSGDQIIQFSPCKKLIQ